MILRRGLLCWLAFALPLSSCHSGAQQQHLHQEEPRVGQGVSLKIFRNETRQYRFSPHSSPSSKTRRVQEATLDVDGDSALVG